MTDPRLVPCLQCDGSAVIGHRITVYEHGCGFSHNDTQEEPCPYCEGTGGAVIETQPITLDDLEEAFAP